MIKTTHTTLKSGHLRLLRKNLGLTQYQLAALLSVSVDTIISWDNDRRIPSRKSILKLADLCNKFGQPFDINKMFSIVTIDI